MTETSGLYNAGTILLLVGAIMSGFGALMMVGLSGVMAVLLAANDQGGAPELAVIFGVYGVLALLLIAGAVFGFVAFGKARHGDPQGGFVFGLVGSMLPPVQVLLLLGAIFCKVSPEGSDGSH